MDFSKLSPFLENVDTANMYLIVYHAFMVILLLVQCLSYSVQMW